MAALELSVALVSRTQMPATLRGLGTLLDHFRLGSVLGRGRFGTVRLAVHNRSGELFAIKRIEKKAPDRPALAGRMLRNELRILRKCVVALGECEGDRGREMPSAVSHAC